MDATMRALVGRSFSGAALQAGVSAQYAHVQLWNPAGSGKVLVLRRIVVSMALNGYFRVARYDAALTTAEGSELNHNPTKGAASGQVRRQTNAAQLVTGAGRIRLMGITSAGSTELDLTDTPIVITEGTGIVTVPDGLNIVNYSSFDWDE